MQFTIIYWESSLKIGIEDVGAMDKVNGNVFNMYDDNTYSPSFKLTHAKLNDDSVLNLEAQSEEYVDETQFTHEVDVQIPKEEGLGE